MLPQRSPNFPPTRHSALRPGSIRFTTVASMAPVPEAASMSTSPCVWCTQRRSSLTRLYTSRNTSVRWCGGTCESARRMRTGISTGPGVNSRGLVDVVAAVAGCVTVMERPPRLSRLVGVLPGRLVGGMRVGRLVGGDLRVRAMDRLGLLGQPLERVLQHLVHGVHGHEREVGAHLLGD